MNFDFSPEQLQLKDEARKLLADRGGATMARRAIDTSEGIDRDLWKTLGELGFLGAAIPEAWGGSGAGPLELCVIAEELGRSLAPVPFMSSICLAAPVLLDGSADSAKERWLPRLATGDAIACVAVDERPGRTHAGALEAHVRDGKLSGTKWPVIDGAIADLALVLARDADGLGLYAVDLKSSGVRKSSLQSLDPSRGLARLDFDAAPAERVATDAWPLLERAFDRAAVLMGFEQVGGAEQALDMARQYALDRYAFGRPIGSFQAIKHKLADMYVSLVLARSNCTYGAWALAQDAPELGMAAAAARVSATQAYLECAKENIQVHGGMGYTWELDCHLYYRRANLLAVALGGLTQWQDRLIEQIH